MTVDPKATTVMCFGDSNTHGQTPNKSGRYPSDVRWTGQLQRILGDSYYVIEEGLGGRTTDSDHFREGKPGRNGFTYFKPALETHLPLDIIVIMLGTNDVKNTYNKTPEEITHSLAEYVEYTRKVVGEKDMKQPKIILISPTPIDERSIQDVYDETSVQKSLELAPEIKRVAEDNQCIFLDAAGYAKVGEDGIHLTRESNEPLAKAVAGAIQS